MFCFFPIEIRIGVVDMEGMLLSEENHRELQQP
jgi:hypothetical protein